MDCVFELLDCQEKCSARHAKVSVWPLWVVLELDFDQISSGGRKKYRNFENIPYFERSSDETGCEVVLPPTILNLLERNLALKKVFTTNNYFTINSVYANL